MCNLAIETKRCKDWTNLETKEDIYNNTSMF